MKSSPNKNRPSWRQPVEEIDGELSDGREVTIHFVVTPADPGCFDLNSTLLRPPEPASIEIIGVYDGETDIIDVLDSTDLDRLEAQVWATEEGDIRYA